MLKYPFVKQEEEKDCAAASLAMVIKYYKGYISLSKLREMLMINREGTTAYHIVLAASNIGFKSACYYTDFDNLLKENIMLPIIVNVLEDNKYKHFSVIYEINIKTQKILIANPASGLKKISFDEFKSIFNNYIITFEPVKPISNIKDDSINYKYYVSIFFQNKKILFKIIIFSIFITLTSVLSSFYIEYLIKAINSNSINNLKNILYIFLSLFFLKNICSFLRNKALVLINMNLDYNLTMDTYNNILSLPYHFYRTKTTGDLISRINDLASIKDLLAKVFLIIIIDIPLTILACVFLFILSPFLFFLSLFIILFYFLIIILFSRILKNYIMRIKNQKAIITSYMVEAISGFETVKGLKLKKYVFTKFKKAYYNFLNTISKYHIYYYLEDNLKNMISDLGFVFITFIGSILVMRGNLTLGALFSFNALIIYYLEPIKNILSMDADIKDSICSVKRVEEIRNNKKEESNSANSMKGNIDIKNLSYSFDNVKSVLKNINLSIGGGDKVLVLGPSGSGKSTLFKLLMKYYKISSNHIFVSNNDINNISNSSKILYINQTENLFTDTLYNNLVLGKNISANDLNEVIDICFLDSIIKKDSLGINQVIEENGFNLSGGERQRIVLARTILFDFDILIIDEGLNQVDVDLERTILIKLYKKFKDKTIIVISHRISNNDIFDKIINFKSGHAVLNDNKERVVV